MFNFCIAFSLLNANLYTSLFSTWQRNRIGIGCASSFRTNQFFIYSYWKREGITRIAFIFFFFVFSFFCLAYQGGYIRGSVCMKNGLLNARKICSHLIKCRDISFEYFVAGIRFISIFFLFVFRLELMRFVHVHVYAFLFSWLVLHSMRIRV